MPEVRQLAAIMFTDIVGYTAHMQDDEARARAMRDRLQEIHHRLVSRHNGQVLQIYGDGILCSFPSAVEAAFCAVGIQNELRQGEPVSARIGIHVGDVVFDSGVVVGDGVNIASRIEHLAAAGGICVSRRVYEDIANHRGLEARSIGMKELKNVRQPIEVFELTGEGLGVSELGGVTAGSGVRSLWLPAGKKLLIPVAATVIAAVLAIWLFSPSGVEPGLPDLPTEKYLAVLPFKNVGEEQENRSLCDGLVETLNSKLTQLEQFHGSLWVIPMTDIHTRGIASAVEAQQTFGVNLVVTGSVQKIGERLRLTLNLVDPKTLRQLESSVIDGHMAHISGLQEEAVARVAGMLRVELQPAARRVLAAGGTTVPGAYEFYLRGRGYLQRYDDTKNLDDAISLFRRAIKEDEHFTLAHAGLGEAYWRKYEISKAAEWVDSALIACEYAVSLDPELAPVHETLGLIHGGTGRFDEAIGDFERALVLDPASATAYSGLGRSFESIGRLDEAERTFQTAIMAKPDYWASYNDLGRFYYRHGRFDDAVTQFRQVVALTPDNYRGYLNIGSSLIHLDRQEEAIQMYKRSLEVQPNLSGYSNLATYYYYERDYGEAARMYGRALEFRDSDHRIWGFLASAYYWAPEERPRSRAAFEQAIRLAEEQMAVNPNDPELLSSTATYYVMMGEKEKARELLEMVLALESNELEVMTRIGEVYEHLGNREEALIWIGRALARGYSLSDIQTEPGLKELREDPRFEILVQQVGEPTPG